jgi:3-hydroxyacyl-CoA dehydrogenase
MKLEDIKSIGVIGGGVMGGGIAQTTALAGYKTIIREVSDEVIEKSKDIIVNGRFGLQGGVARGKLTQQQMDQALANLSFTTRTEDLKDCDLIIETVSENMELKQKVFAELDKVVRKDAIFTSNSSALTHAEISKDVARKDRYIGWHWSSPANVMKMAELIYTADTSEEVIQLLEVLCQRLGKVSVRVKDVPGNTGYVGNRIYGAIRREAQKIIEEGIATAEGIDTVMETGWNWPVGPFGMGRGARSGWS